MFEYINVAFIGVFMQGQFDNLNRQFPGLDAIPQIDDTARRLKELCNVKTTNSIAILDPSGTLIEVTDKTYNTVSGHPDQNWIDHHVLATKNRPWLKEQYAAFKAEVPPGLKQAGIHVKYGRFAQAQTLAEPFLISTTPVIKAAAEQAMTMIKTYQDALLKELEGLAGAGQVGEAFRIATRAYDEFRVVKCTFTDALKAFLAKHKADPQAKEIEKARKPFEAARMFLAQGKQDQAVKYLEGLVKSFPATWYGQRAAALLNLLK
ncbi:MAG: hypothetical protein ABIF71_02250 [Planctomycetota bacterium]